MNTTTSSNFSFVLRDNRQVSPDLSAERLAELTSQLKNKTINLEALQQTLVELDPDCLIEFVTRLIGYDDREVQRLNQIEFPNDTDSFPYMLSHGRTLSRLLTVNRESQLKLDSDPVFMDLGCGAGLPSLLMHLATGCSAFGIDIQPKMIDKANEKVREFALDPHVSFSLANAAESDLTHANIFYIFNPFRGETMRKVFDKLIDISKQKQILVCSAGYCSEKSRLESEFTMVEPGFYRSK
jgi:SAM-dependent methyltransferase